MTAILGKRIRTVLAEKGLSRTQAVARMGWRNQTKGLRALDSWLAGERFPEGDQWGRLAALLGMPVDEMRAMARRDEEGMRAEADAERAKDQRFRLDIRVAGIFVTHRLPAHMTPEEAMAAARSMLMKYQRSEYRRSAAYLNAPDNATIILDSNGNPRGRMHGAGCWNTI